MNKPVRWTVRMRTLDGGHETERDVEGTNAISAGIALGRALEREGGAEVEIVRVRRNETGPGETKIEAVLADFEQATGTLRERWDRYEECERERLNHAFGLLPQGEGIEPALDTLMHRIGWARAGVSESTLERDKTETRQEDDRR